MSFNRPSLDELITRTTDDVSSRVTGNSGNVLRRSVLGVLSRVFAGLAHLLHGHLDWNSRQLFPDTAESENLERWAAIWGITRNAATYATGTVIFTGQDGAGVPTNTLVALSNGQRYGVVTGGVISGGSVELAVTAIEAGQAGNVEGGVLVSIVGGLADVNSTATVTAGGMTGGLDAESDDALRERLITRIQQPPAGGAKHDYEAWAKEVTGVKRVWVYPERSGPGTVIVAIEGEVRTSTHLAESSLVDAVQAHIEEERPVTAQVGVFPPIIQPLNVTVSVVPDTPAVRAAVEAELADMLDRSASPGGIVPISHFYEAISIASGEQDNALISPSANVQADPDSVLVLGTVTWV